MRCVPRRRNRVSTARGARPRRRDVHDPRPREPERHIRESPAHRIDRARRRRRGADRQVPADLPPTMSTVAARRERGGAEPRLRTIGSVCARSCASSSRTSRCRRSGTSRIRAHRAQTDAWGIPALRAGRHRAADDDPQAAARRVPPAAGDPRGTRRPGSVQTGRADGALACSVTRTRSTRASSASAQPCPTTSCASSRSSVSSSRSEGGERFYGESEADIAGACARLARFGVDARHLRTFVTGAAPAALARAARRARPTRPQRPAPQGCARGPRGAVAWRRSLRISCSCASCAEPWSEPDDLDLRDGSVTSPTSRPKESCSRI